MENEKKIKVVLLLPVPLPLLLFICTAVRRNWTSTSVCCSARTMLRPLSPLLPLRILPLPRTPQNNP